MLTAQPFSDFGFELSKNTFGMQFAYGMDGALQIYQQYAPLVVDLLYNIVGVVKKRISQRDLTANMLSEICKDI